MSDSQRQRLFFALPVPGADVLLRQAYERLAAFPRQLKAVAPGHYHITLKFLGETDADTARRLREDFRVLDPGVAAQTCVLKGLGAFPGTRRPRVIWCGIDTDIEGLRRAQRAIEDLAARHGFPRESRPFTPHLTLARVRGEGDAPGEIGRFLADNAATVFGESRFDRIVLFKSDLKREGPVYTDLEELRLG
jgi:RNA 2',3'-cyclic 3'-phosphodiesterase